MITVLEQIRITTPLGIRFWDAVREVQVRDGLLVTARPEENPNARAIEAFRTGRGIYAFQQMPGLRDFENGTISAFTSPPLLQNFIVSATDQQNRFMPTLFRVELPLLYRGLFRPAGELSPPDEDAATRFYLFSAPTRNAPPGIAIIRGQLQNEENGRPAAFALLELAAGGQSWFGLADVNGSVAVMFPYPEFQQTMMESPVQLAVNQQWPMVVRIYFQPEMLDFPAGEMVPLLNSIRNQGQGQIRPLMAEPPADEMAIQLTYEEPLILRTDTLSNLVVLPAT